MQVDTEALYALGGILAGLLGGRGLAVRPEPVNHDRVREQDARLARIEEKIDNMRREGLRLVLVDGKQEH